MSRKWKIILMAGFLTACDSSIVDEADKSDYPVIIQSAPVGRGELIIARKSSGGGATGDLIYDLLACPSELPDKCDVLAHVDTNNQISPKIALSQHNPTLIINRDDTIWDYSSFTYKLNPEAGTRILLSYR